MAGLGNVRRHTKRDSFLELRHWLIERIATLHPDTAYRTATYLAHMGRRLRRRGLI